MTEVTLNDAANPAQGSRRPVEKEAKIFVASQWQLMWWRFTSHKVAMVSGIIVILIYTVALFAEFLAPYSPDVVECQIVICAAAIVIPV